MVSMRAPVVTSPSLRTSARRPPRWISHRSAPLLVRRSMCEHGSQRRWPRHSTLPTRKRRPTRALRSHADQRDRVGVLRVEGSCALKWSESSTERSCAIRRTPSCRCSCAWRARSADREHAERPSVGAARWPAVVGIELRRVAGLPPRSFSASRFWCTSTGCQLWRRTRSTTWRGGG